MVGPAGAIAAGTHGSKRKVTAMIDEFEEEEGEIRMHAEQTLVSRRLELVIATRRTKWIRRLTGGVATKIPRPRLPSANQ